MTPSQASYRLLFLICVTIPEATSKVCYSSICRYTLHVSMQFSHLYEAEGKYYDVDLDPGTDVLRVVNNTVRSGMTYNIGDTVKNPKDVITLDGIKRKVFTINGQFPGPTIEVTEGAELVVTVVNDLNDNDISIHWHGFTHENNPWMDGVPFLTQCPIIPSGKFTYRIKPPHAGTFWYHSHVGWQRSDGLLGALIVHPNMGPVLPYHVMLIQDWFHAEGDEYYYAHGLAGGKRSGHNLYGNGDYVKLVDGSHTTRIDYVSGLINGRGRWNQQEKWPLSTFTVQQGSSYLLHIVHTGVESPLQFSIDGHELSVIGVDSRDIEEIVVDSIILYSGERIVVKLNTNQPMDEYWIRSSLFHDEHRDNSYNETLAVLRYKGGGNRNIMNHKKICNSSDKCRVFNCPFKDYPQFLYTVCIHLTDAKTTYTDLEKVKFGLDQEYPDHEFFVNFLRGDTSNYKRYVPSTSPIYQTDSEVVSCDDCSDDESCDCTYTFNLPYNKVIQFVIMSYPTKTAATHPMHFHGHHVAVVKEGFPNYTYPDAAFQPNPDITCNNKFCNKAFWSNGMQPQLNLQNPPLKDTVNVGASGYTVVRFRSNNPGAWLVHCHMIHHGRMAFLIMEARDHISPIPPRMPTCASSFALTDAEFEAYENVAKIAVIMGSGYKKVIPHYNNHDVGSLQSKEETKMAVCGTMVSTIALAAFVLGCVLTALCTVLIKKYHQTGKNNIEPTKGPHETTSIKQLSTGVAFDNGIMPEKSAN